jgi:uncharacterized protein (TIGR00255 family)
MILSMTGYSKIVRKLDGKNMHIELKSLNSKQADISVKIPYVFREKEMEIRNILIQRLERGKIDCLVYFEVIENEQVPMINPSVVKNYYHQLKNISDDLHLEADDRLLPVIMRLPEILKTGKQEMDEKEWHELVNGLEEGISLLNEYRLTEGKRLEEDIRGRVQTILSLLFSVGPHEETRMGRVRDRIRKNLFELAPGAETDPNRFEQEMIYYLERIDFSEEKIRLENHCRYFIESMNASQGVGKMLGFIAQEIGREVNTLGSKANDSAIQKIVVQMKDELEKVKEQLANVL